MQCAEAQPLIDAYLDGELDLVRNLELERHFESCRECGPIRQSAFELHSAVQRLAYHRAPLALANRVRAIAESRPQHPKRTFVSPAALRWIGVAAALALIATVSFLAGNRVTPSHHELVAREVVSAHVRSLMAGHLTDVPSTDQHTVKPWFDGKVDFAPPVVNLAADGFPLIGGRLDYMDGRSVAALVYQRRLHYINLFIWPTPEKDTEPALQSHDGYNIYQWNENAMTFWAVSDLSSADLQNFVALVRK